jgi:hypothetical protein
MIKWMMGGRGMRGTPRGLMSDLSLTAKLGSLRGGREVKRMRLWPKVPERNHIIYGIAFALHRCMSRARSTSSRACAGNGARYGSWRGLRRRTLHGDLLERNGEVRKGIPSNQPELKKLINPALREA